jgi:hypothetical protein
VDKDSHRSMIMEMGAEWLRQYLRLRRQAPELAAELAKQTDQFELVPIPKHLLERLTGREDAPQAPAVQAADTSGNPRKAVAEAFATALGAGNINQVMALISSHFIDADGRRRLEIRKAIEALIGESVQRACRVLEFAESEVSQRAATVRLRLQWTAAADARQPPLQEEVTLELLLQQDKPGVWQISRIATV